MSGGKYSIPLNEVPEILARAKECKLNLDLVQFIVNEPFVLFFDVDQSSNAINDIIKAIESELQKHYKPKYFKLRMVFKNLSKSCYHLYYPLIILNHLKYADLVSKINASLPNAVDNSSFIGSKLRVEGFEKWNRKDKCFESHTNYIFDAELSNSNDGLPEPFTPAFYELTMLFANGKKPTKEISKMKKKKKNVKGNLLFFILTKKQTLNKSIHTFTIIQR